MRIRVMDTWMHEQDVREAVERPGHDSGAVVELVLDELQAALGYVVGKKAGAPDGSSVTFQLTGPAGRTVQVLVDGRAAVVDAAGRAADDHHQPAGTAFTRLAGGRTKTFAGHRQWRRDARRARARQPRLHDLTSREAP